MFEKIERIDPPDADAFEALFGRFTGGPAGKKGDLMSQLGEPFCFFKGDGLYATDMRSAIMRDHTYSHRVAIRDIGEGLPLAPVLSR